MFLVIIHLTKDNITFFLAFHFIYVIERRRKYYKNVFFAIFTVIVSSSSTMFRLFHTFRGTEHGRWSGPIDTAAPLRAYIVIKNRNLPVSKDPCSL